VCTELMKSTHKKLSLLLNTKQALQMDKKKTIARIENTLIFDTHYKNKLTAKEHKILLLLIAKLDPVRQSEFHEQFVSVKELKRVLLDNRSGSFVKELNRFRKRLMDKTFIFNSTVTVDNEALEGEIRWFQHIVPLVKDGVKGVEFMFAKRLQPFLIALKEYVKIDYTEVLPLNSGASVRLFQYFKAHRSKMTKYQKRSKLKFELDELKNILGVSGKYKDYRNFRKRILEVVELEINEHTSIGTKFSPIKTGYSVTHIGFEIWDKGNKTQSGQLADLTFAQERAKNLLEDYGIEAEQKAGTLVNWFLKKKVFEQGDMFAKIMEQLAEQKKQGRESDNKAWRNRELAKGMTAAEFRKYINKNQ